MPIKGNGAILTDWGECPAGNFVRREECRHWVGISGGHNVVQQATIVVHTGHAHALTLSTADYSGILLSVE